MIRLNAILLTCVVAAVAALSPSVYGKDSDALEFTKDSLSQVKRNVAEGKAKARLRRSGQSRFRVGKEIGSTIDICNLSSSGGSNTLVRNDPSTRMVPKCVDSRGSRLKPNVLLRQPRE
jgi:hypothetical protein